MNRDKLYKQKRIEKQNFLWKNFFKKMEQARLKYDERKYRESQLLWSTILDELENFGTLSAADERIRQYKYAHAFCFHTICLIEIDLDQALKLENFEKFVELYSKLAGNPKYDFFYEKIIMRLEIRKKYEEMKLLILTELPLLKQRSLAHQAITKTMLAQLAINGKLTLHWPKLIVTYLISSTEQFPMAYLLLIDYLLKTGNLTMTNAKIAEVKTTPLWKSYRSRILSLEARYHAHSDNPQKDIKKSIALLEESITISPTADICFSLAKFYDNNADFKVSTDHIINLYKLAARIYPEAAHRLALKYMQNKEIHDPEKTRQWYEAAIQFKYPPSCYNYALLMHQNPEYFDKCLEILLIAKNTIPQANYLYIKLRMSALQNKDVFYGKKTPPQMNIHKKEARRFYRDLIYLNQTTELPRAELQVLAGMIQEFILKDMKIAIDHYRAAAEYGSEDAHEKSFFIYCAKILAETTSPDEEKYYIRTLLSLLDSMKFFFNRDIPKWAIPFNKEKFKQSISSQLQELTELKCFADDYKIASPLVRLRTQLTSEKNKIIEIVNLNFNDIDAENSAELVRYAGQLAHNLIVSWGADSVDFLNERLTALLAMIVKKIKSGVDHFNLWSIMCIFEGFGKFKIYSDHKDIIEPLHFLMNFIRSKLELFGSWKLIMLLEATKNLCYKIPGVPAFVEKIITHTLTNWAKLFTEIDGDIRLCYILAILDNHYHFFTRKDHLKLLLLQILEKIIKENVSLYESRSKVVKDCFFSFNYFQGIKIIDSKDIAPMLNTLQTLLAKTPQKTTCSKFQKSIVDFICQYFCFNLCENQINCIEITEEKVVFTKPMDLGLTFSVTHPQTGSKVLVDVIIEADGTPHFWLPVTTMATQPIYDLDTLFYNTVIQQQGVNIVRMEYFNWSSLTILQRYAFFQEQFAKYGLVFPPFSEVKPVQSDSFWENDEFTSDPYQKENFKNQESFALCLENSHTSLWWRSSKTHDESKTVPYESRDSNPIPRGDNCHADYFPG